MNDHSQKDNTTSQFDPDKLPRCSVARCPELADYHVTRDDFDDPLDELRCEDHSELEGITKEKQIPASEKQIPNEATDDGTAICFVSEKLDIGDKVLFNDRSRVLEVTARHKNPITKTYRRRGSTRDYYDIVELTGNGTTYHLLYRFGTKAGPILRKQSQWTEIETDNGIKYDYSVSGDRIKQIQIVSHQDKK